MRILYVEDDHTNLALVERIAYSGRHEVLSYASAEDAIANIESLQPDLMLVDHFLDGPMKGLDMVRKLRDAGYTLPIVAMSSFSSETDCLAAGCDHYFVKPVPVNQVWALIEHYAEHN
jgi:CheY-like chemotaxis protein